MTGEMASIRRDGMDSNGEQWTVHAAVARSVGGVLRPFDVYQGPYISVGPDLRAGSGCYAPLISHLGAVRLWLSADDDGGGVVYREDTDTQAAYFPAWDTRRACKAARSLLKG